MKAESSPLYEKVADEIATMIATGTLSPGGRGRPLRTIKQRRQGSMTTMNEACGMLEDEGLIQARPHSGHLAPSRMPVPAPSCAAPRRRQVPVLTDPLM